jgi:hypothetical protein
MFFIQTDESNQFVEDFQTTCAFTERKLLIVDAKLITTLRPSPDNMAIKG